jgi:hypothetical protein
MLTGPSYKTPPCANPSEFDLTGMKHALFQAERALKLENAIPIGAALVRSDGVVVGVGRNRRVQEGSPTKHGEVSTTFLLVGVRVRRSGRTLQWANDGQVK